MAPLLSDQERIFINKFVYRFEPIERGDVVKSQEVNTWFIIAASALVLLAFSGPMGTDIGITLRGILANSYAYKVEGGDLAIHGIEGQTVTPLLLARRFRVGVAPERRPFPAGWRLELRKRPRGRLVYLRRSSG